MTYPYQRLALPCGCREIVTGPGAIDEYCCQEHTSVDGSDALVDARRDAFGRNTILGRIIEGAARKQVPSVIVSRTLVEGTAHAIRSVLATRDGISDELLESIADRLERTLVDSARM